MEEIGTHKNHRAYFRNALILQFL